MGRLDFKRGRFTADYETDQINGSLRGWQAEFGDDITYFRFWKEQSEMDPVFDEATKAGRLYHPPKKIAVLHATHTEGGNEIRPQGFYYNDELYVIAFFDQLMKVGFTNLDLQTYDYLKDRIVYDYKVFRVTKINVTGQVQERDVMVSIEGTQVKPDEMLNDPQFKSYLDPRFGAR